MIDDRRDVFAHHEFEVDWCDVTWICFAVVAVLNADWSVARFTWLTARKLSMARWIMPNAVN